MFGEFEISKIPIFCIFRFPRISKMPPLQSSVSYEYPVKRQLFWAHAKFKFIQQKINIFKMMFE